MFPYFSLSNTVKPRYNEVSKIGNILCYIETSKNHNLAFYAMNCRQKILVYMKCCETILIVTAVKKKLIKKSPQKDFAALGICRP